MEILKRIFGRENEEEDPNAKVLEEIDELHRNIESHLKRINKQIESK